MILGRVSADDGKRTGVRREQAEPVEAVARAKREQRSETAMVWERHCESERCSRGGVELRA